MNDGSLAATPDWIKSCLSRPGVSHYIPAAGNRIHYLEWPGPPGAGEIVLLHGFKGHAHWWDFVAPWLAENYRVIAMDFGGMGESGRRTEYSLQNYVAEVAGLIKGASVGPVTLIGHSFGGRCTIRTCFDHPELIARAILVDSRVRFLDDPGPQTRPDSEQGPLKHYPSLAAAKARFRLVPEEPPPHPIIFDHLANASLRKAGDHWIWKFDPAIVRAIDAAGPDGGLLGGLGLSVDYVCGEHSTVVSSGLAQRIAKSLPGPGRGPIIIPAAYHHIPAGQPLALTAALRALLAKAMF